MRVALFKCGPDYLDPTYHRRAAGAASHNLDGWMMGREAVRATFQRASHGADIALIEGVMGLFDGASPTGDEGSTAEIAKWLDAPVLLVVDAGGMARSLAALVAGFAGFDRGLRVAGVICNRVGSRGHLDLLRRAQTAPPIVGGLPREPELAFPERHLGLLTAHEDAVAESLFAAWGARASEWLDLDAILECAGSGRVGRVAPKRSGPLAPKRSGPLAPVRGERVRERGPHTPQLARSAPLPNPPPADGGRDRIWRARIVVASRSRSTRRFTSTTTTTCAASKRSAPSWSRSRRCATRSFPPSTVSISAAATPSFTPRRSPPTRRCATPSPPSRRSGRPIYAECGGLMYLTRAIRTRDGRSHAMVGLFPCEAVMADRLEALGYVEVELEADTPLGPAGTRFRGHQFRYSRLTEPDGAIALAYSVRRRRGQEAFREGYRAGDNVLASYVHAHWASNPRVAEAFVASCAAARARGAHG